MEFLSQPDLMLYKFVYNTVRAHGRENHVLTNFRLRVELVRDAVFSSAVSSSNSYFS